MTQILGMEDIKIDKIEGLRDEFIMGMDVSTYVSVTQSGVVFKDFDGKELSDSEFFEFLKSCGIDYIRVKIWNDPYDKDGNGYGGGNSDIEKAALIGKWATDAGMKTFVNFHYSDFWADPQKQAEPKAWQGYTLEQKEVAIYEYTKESLNYLKSRGVNIGMVQVGNETTNAICGEYDWNNMCKLFNAGSRAVREFDKNVLIGLHFADPQNNLYGTHAKYLHDNNVDYDVFGSSYYPLWHKPMSNLIDQLCHIIDTYGKKVMLYETAFPYTLEDYDGHKNTLNTIDYVNPPIEGYPEASVQGQADYMRFVIQSFSDMGEAALGIVYWEGAWNSIGNVYVDGKVDEAKFLENRKKWEKYGSGWASSYALEYDAEDVGSWYGGSSVENQSFFDGDNKALPSLKVYNYVRTGTN